MVDVFLRSYRFPRGPSDLEYLDIAALARQIEVTVPADAGLILAERRAKRFRTEIRVGFGVREATVADADALTEWLRDHAAAEASGEIETMIERLEERCPEWAIEPPRVERVERIARAALRAHEECFHANIYGRLSPATREHLDELLSSADGEGDHSTIEEVPGRQRTRGAFNTAWQSRAGQPRQNAGGIRETGAYPQHRPSGRFVQSRFAMRAGGTAQLQPDG